MLSKGVIQKAWALGLGLCFLFSAHGMTLSRQGPRLFATGPVEDDYRKFVDALDQAGVEQVVFVNSPGGDLWTGMRVGRLIAQKGLKTVTAGTCVSACSIMFMGGAERTFSDAFRAALTYVGIHGPHNKLSLEVNNEQAGQIYAFFKTQMAGQFNAAIINQALFDMDDAGSLLKVFDGVRAPKFVSYHCKSEQTQRINCTEFKDQDALSLGVVTRAELTHVDLPESMQLQPRLAGAVLSSALQDSENFFRDLSARQCKSDQCKRTFAEYASYKENKALAIPLNDTGYGMANGRDTLPQAYYGALYFCNHVKDKPARLCETQVVNGYDVRSMLTAGEQSHATALAELKVPKEKFFGGEEYGGVFTSASGLRTQKLHDITPQTLDGIKTVGTQELAGLLIGPHAPVLVDVWAGGDESIPTALTLFGGGAAYDDVPTDAAYESRFAGLLKLLSPDPARMLIFYCSGRDCWLSVNAAMRARKLGFSNVGWYRGGWSSWRSANLPFAKPVVRAVVQ